MDEMPEQLIEFNKGKGWRTTPYHSYYKINADQNLHIEAIMFQDLLRNARTETILSLIIYLHLKFNNKNLICNYL